MRDFAFVDPDMMTLEEDIREQLLETALKVQFQSPVFFAKPVKSKICRFTKSINSQPGSSGSPVRF